jgi:hypothetical protein
MPRFETTTYGFGRVSPVTRPSPYSLVELRGRPLPDPEPADPHERWRRSSDAARRRTRRDNLRRGFAAFFTLVAVIGGTAFIAARQTSPEHDAKALASVVKVPRPAPPLSEEALRLSRSAIAVARYVPRH